MKKIAVVSTMSLFLWCSSTAFSQDNATPETNQPKFTSSQAPLFTMMTTKDDSPALAKKKAALRLFKGYSVTVGLLSSCHDKAPKEAENAIQSFNRRNGTTLGLIIATIKRLSGFNQEIKMVLDTAITSEVMVGVPSCQAFFQEVLDGNYNIFSAPEYAEDYVTLRSSKPVN